MCHPWLQITWDDQQHSADFSLCVTVLANVVYFRKSAQDEMQALGGVELMLAHCQVLWTFVSLATSMGFQDFAKVIGGAATR